MNKTERSKDAIHSDKAGAQLKRDRKNTKRLQEQTERGVTPFVRRLHTPNVFSGYEGNGPVTIIGLIAGEMFIARSDCEFDMANMRGKTFDRLWLHEGFRFKKGRHQ